MEVLNANAAVVSNFEALRFLKETRHDLKSNKEIKRNSDNTNPLHTIAYETVKYLETTTAAKQDENSVTLFLKEIARFNLTKTEKVILLNLRPTNELELNLIIQSPEQDRFTEETMDEMLQVIQRTLTEK